MLTVITSHSALIAGIAVAVLDLIFALNPASSSNGVLHWIYQFAVGQKSPK